MSSYEEFKNYLKEKEILEKFLEEKFGISSPEEIVPQILNIIFEEKMKQKQEK